MDSIKQTVSAVMAQLAAEHGRAQENGPAAWLEKVFTAKELTHIRFQYYRKQALGLAVDSSTWLYHVNLRKEELLTGLRRIAPEVKDLRVRLGASPPRRNTGLRRGLGASQNSYCKRRRK